MTTTITDFHNPSIVLFPVNNNRTAWRPIGSPAILVEPDRTDPLDNPIEMSQVSDVRIIIEDVPQRAAIAGHDNIGLFSPDRELFAINVSRADLQRRLIDRSAQRFFKADGTEITQENAALGDFMQYTTITGIRDTITYIPSAFYYDLSDFTIGVEELPSDHYFLTYSARYFVRVTGGTNNSELLCIDASRTALAIMRFAFNHPGEIIDEQVRLTPQPYFTNTEKSEDTTIAFYRPFTDALQNIFDESNLLESVNWVNNISPELVPYLAYLLGLDIPFFPQSLDRLRKVVLKNIVRLQQLKGSRRALIDLFNIFGFSIFIINLYWSEKACRLVRPGQQLPPDFDDQEILIDQQCQIEPILANYGDDGFGDLTIPLLFRPTQTEVNDGIASRVEGGTIVVDGFLVEEGSAAYLQLQEIIDNMNNNPTGYGEANDCTMPPVTGTGIIGYSQISLDSLTGEVQNEAQMGVQPPFSSVGTSYDITHNTISLTFNGAILFDTPNVINPGGPDLRLFGFATYDRQEFIVPEDMQDLQSNRFDVQLLTRVGEQVAPDVLNFLIDFLFKFKAFHSLLNVIIYRLDLVETYEVTDWCVGGNIKQRFDTDAGRLQVPPAIIPNIPEDDTCALSPEDLGYKPEDIALRNDKLENLQEEHDAWRSLDTRAGQTTDIDTRINPALDNPNRDECKFNSLGQDRIAVQDKSEDQSNQYDPDPNANTSSISSDTNLDISPVDEIENGAFDPLLKASRNAEYFGYGSFNKDYTVPGDPICEDDRATDFCYKGRVQDELLHQEAIVPNDSIRCKPCSLGMGTGLYYFYPTPSKLIAANTPKNVFSGLSSKAGVRGYNESSQKDYLTADYNRPLSAQNNSFLGRLLRGYDQPDNSSIHYTNKPLFTEEMKKQIHFLAIQRPNLDIEKTNLHFPGTRFPSMNRLAADFTSSIYGARPWDPLYSTYCGPTTLACSNDPSFLNAELVENDNGDLVLSFDDEPYMIVGNGLTPDISSLGSQSPPSTFGLDWNEATDIVHSVYSSELYSGHPAVSLENVCPCSLTDEDPSAEGTLEASDLIRVSEPLFQSAGECADDTYLDYCDGYACVRGYQDRGDTNIDRDGLYQELFGCLGIPVNQDPSDADSLFFLSSGIRIGTGERVDCGCSILDCDDPTAITEVTGASEPLRLPCIIDEYVDQDGERDWDCDKVEVETNMVLEEEIGVHCDKLDGSIPTLFELIAGCCETT